MQTDGIVVFAAGTVAWMVAGLVLLLLRGTLEDHGSGWWLWIPVAGVGIGLIGIVVAVRHRARGRANPSVTKTSEQR